MLILAQYLATGVPYESVLQKIEWVMSMILLHVIRFPKNSGRNLFLPGRFKPVQTTA